MKIDDDYAETKVLLGAKRSLKERIVSKIIVEVHKDINKPSAILSSLKTIISRYTDT